jgi:hypothetical protein
MLTLAALFSFQSAWLNVRWLAAFLAFHAAGEHPPAAGIPQ